MNLDEQVSCFAKTLLNIIHIFIPHETIACDDNDPRCVNKEIIVTKKLLKRIKPTNYIAVLTGKNVFFEKFEVMQNQLNRCLPRRSVGQY